MAVPPNLIGGRFALHWIYFQFYQTSRRQKRFAGWVRDPSFTAWNLLGYTLGGPIVALLLLANKYLHFMQTLGKILVYMDLPGSSEHAGIFAVIACACILDLCLLIAMFGGKYEKIIEAFSAYDRSKHDIIPGLAMVPVWTALLVISFYGVIYWDSANLWVVNLSIWGIFIVTEI
ncbi:MAG: hypothetical protein C4338_03050, partial [Rhodanobacteraceae bacterium]